MGRIWIWIDVNPIFFSDLDLDCNPILPFGFGLDFQSDFSGLTHSLRAEVAPSMLTSGNGKTLDMFAEFYAVHSA